jgi:hypothetical protein
MKLPGKLGHASVKFLVDSGGTHNFCSLQTVRRAGLEVKEKSSREVILGDGQSKTIVLASVKAHIQIGSKYQDVIEFQVLYSSKECAILGMPWLHRQNPNINWREKSISSMDGPVKLSGETDTSLAKTRELRLNHLMLSERQLRRSLKQKQTTLFLGFISLLEMEKDDSIIESVRKSDLSISSQKQLEAVLAKYEDVFPEKLPGLAPIRGFEHDINLFDEKPVHRMPYRLSPLERQVKLQKCWNLD